VDFIIVGDKPNLPVSLVSLIQKLLGISHDAKKFVTDYILEHDLHTTVHLIRFTSNITSAYENCDILCFPSHLNAVGRPVFEAAFFGKPSIVAIRNPEKDTVVHMKTGLCIEEKDANALFKAIEYFYNKKDEVTRMGEEAFKLANENFNIKNNANKVLQLYNDVLNNNE
jgi:glycosyltransferase involved in cell wall biosynthesis